MLRGLRIRTCLGPVVLLLVASACTNEQSPEEGPTPTAPQITEAAEDPALIGSLLSLEELEGASRAPSGLIQQPVQDASLFENPDPRAPCGARIDQPAAKDAAIAAFATAQPPQLTLFHMVWNLPEGEAQALVEGVRSDINPNCPPFVSKTPTGEQRAQFLKEIPLSGLGSDAVAASLRITVSGLSAYAVLAVVRDGTRLSLLSVFSEDPVSARFVRDVAAATAKKL